MFISDTVQISIVSTPKPPRNSKMVPDINQLAPSLNEQRVLFVDGSKSVQGGYGEVARAILHVEDCLHTMDTSRPVASPCSCQIVAVKTLLVKENACADVMEKLFAREVYIWSQLHHENVLEILGHFFRKEEMHFCLVCPWVPDGNAFDYLKAHKLELIDRLRVALDTAKGLHYLHAHNPSICHGDIKAVNVLINGDRAQLCDFGLARMIEEGKTSSGSDFKGSIRWCSPELLTGAKRTTRSDIWAWGWLVWEIMTGEIPFDDTTFIGTVVLRIMTLKLPDTSSLTQVSQQLVKACWEAEPFKRLAMSDVIVVLQQAINDAPASQTQAPPGPAAIASDTQNVVPPPPPPPSVKSALPVPQEGIGESVPTNSSPVPDPPELHPAPVRHSKRSIWRAIGDFVGCYFCFSCRSHDEASQNVSLVSLALTGRPDQVNHGAIAEAKPRRTSEGSASSTVKQSTAESPVMHDAAVAGIPLSDITPDSLAVRDLVDVTPVPEFPSILRGKRRADEVLVVIKVPQDLQRAIEILHRGGASERRREAEIVAAFRHHIDHMHSLVSPHINPTDGHIELCGHHGVVSPWCQNGNIRDYTKRNPDTELVLDLLGQTFDALKFLHTQQPPVVHGCMKPENVLVDATGRIVLSEIGELPFLEKAVAGITTCGHAQDIRWAPQEVIAGDGWSVQSDVYTVGLLAQSIISGKTPFADLEDLAAIIQAIGAGDSPFHIDVQAFSMGHSAWNLLKRCASIEPTQRPTVISASSQFDACRAASGPLSSNATLHGIGRTVEANSHPQYVQSDAMDTMHPGTLGTATQISQSISTPLPATTADAPQPPPRTGQKLNVQITDTPDSLASASGGGSVPPREILQSPGGRPRVLHPSHAASLLGRSMPSHNTPPIGESSTARTASKLIVNAAHRQTSFSGQSQLRAHVLADSPGASPQLSESRPRALETTWGTDLAQRPIIQSIDSHLHGYHTASGTPPNVPPGAPVQPVIADPITQARETVKSKHHSTVTVSLRSGPRNAEQSGSHTINPTDPSVLIFNLKISRHGEILESAGGWENVFIPSQTMRLLPGDTSSTSEFGKSLNRDLLLTPREGTRENSALERDGQQQGFFSPQVQPRSSILTDTPASSSAPAQSHLRICGATQGFIVAHEELNGILGSRPPFAGVDIARGSEFISDTHRAAQPVVPFGPPGSEYRRRATSVTPDQPFPTQPPHNSPDFDLSICSDPQTHESPMVAVRSARQISFVTYSTRTMAHFVLNFIDDIAQYAAQILPLNFSSVISRVEVILNRTVLKALIFLLILSRILDLILTRICQLFFSDNMFFNPDLPHVVHTSLLTDPHSVGSSPSPRCGHSVECALSSLEPDHHLIFEHAALAIIDSPASHVMIVENIGSSPAKEQPEISALLQYMATSLLERYFKERRSVDLAISIDVFQVTKALRPANHPHRSGTLKAMAIAIFMRYERSGKGSELSKAIDLHQEALDLLLPDEPVHSSSLEKLGRAALMWCKEHGGSAGLDAIDERHEALNSQPGYPNRSQKDQFRPTNFSSPNEPFKRVPNDIALLHDTAVSCLERYQREGRSVALTESIQLFRRVVSLLPPGHPNRSYALSNLANAILMQYEREGGERDLPEVITLYREALSIQPSRDPNRSSSLNNLANVILARYKRNGEEDDLSEAVQLHREALSLFPPGHPNRSTSLNNLASAVFTRYERDGGEEDLSEAVQLYREALSLFPPGHPNRSTSLNYLASAIFTRYERDGGERDLPEAINLYREALSLLPPGHPDRSSSLNNLANVILARYKRNGEEDDLSEAVQLHREALSLFPPGHPNRSTSLNNLASAIFTRYERDGGEEDLPEAVQLYRGALSLRPSGHPNRLTSLNYLASAILTRYERDGGERDLPEAINLYREALSLLPPGHPDRSSSLNNLANVILARYKRNGEEDDLSEAVQLHREALSLFPPGHPNRSTSLNNLASAVFTRYERDGGEEDLSEAVQLYREALSLLPPGHPNCSSSLNNLASVILTRYKRDGGEQDSAEVIDLCRESLFLQPPGHPDRSSSLSNLANAILTRYKRDGGEEDLLEAIQLKRIAEDAS